MVIAKVFACRTVCDYSSICYTSTCLPFFFVLTTISISIHFFVSRFAGKACLISSCYLSFITVSYSCSFATPFFVKFSNRTTIFTRILPDESSIGIRSRRIVDFKSIAISFRDLPTKLSFHCFPSIVHITQIAFVCALIPLSTVRVFNFYALLSCCIPFKTISATMCSICPRMTCRTSAICKINWFTIWTNQVVTTQEVDILLWKALVIFWKIIPKFTFRACSSSELYSAVLLTLRIPFYTGVILICTLTGSVSVNLTLSIGTFHLTIWTTGFVSWNKITSTKTNFTLICCKIKERTITQ